MLLFWEKDFWQNPLTKDFFESWIEPICVFRLLYSEPKECQEHKKSGCVPFHDAAKNGDVETSKWNQMTQNNPSFIFSHLSAQIS